MLLASALTIAPLTRLASAASLESVLMPGKVTNAHAKIEENCTDCHDRADRKQQTNLCLACHKEVAADFTGRKGFHGRLQGLAKLECRSCHSEHLGRGADIVGLAREQFDHSSTDFKIDGAHSTVACADCHPKGRKFREAPSTCVACHRKVDPHAGKLGEKCQDCHATASWGNAKYDHDKTQFALKDRHREVPCAGCHFGNRWKDTPKQCVACHAPDDVHRGERGANCGECHTQVTWKTAKFDHFKETGFALAGVHGRIDCQACHTTGNFKDELPKDCAGCHAGADSHAGRLGKGCEKCHGAEEWKKTSFDHTRDGKFALDGVHVKLACHTCHTAVVKDQKLGTTCFGCHKADDVHSGQLGKECDSCHEGETWRRDVTFDHDLTSYPLVGMHVAVTCAQCHASRRYKGVPSDCLGCHKADDVHKGGLGKDCSQCHSPNGWTVYEFDHGKATGFALSGAHAKAKCSDCHKQPAGEVKVARDCASCHSQDDVHLGQFGRQCDRCHTSISFRRVRLQ